MAQIVAAFGSSHASTYLDPERWEEFRARVRGSYERRYVDVPPERPEIERETPESNRERYAGIRRGLDEARDRLRAIKPDALILIGDDQNENYREVNLPQFAIYTGDELIANDRQTDTQVRHRCDS